MPRSLFGIQFVDFFNIPKVRRLQTLSVLQWTLTFLFLGLIGAFIFVLLLLSPLAFLSAAYLIWYVYDFRTPERGGRRVKWVRRWRVWDYFRDYFPIRVIKTADLNPSRNYIFMYHPHGIMAYGAFLGFATAAGGFEEMFPGLRSTLLSLNYQFLLPLNREYAMALGVAPCSKRSMDWLLTKEGTGNAVVLVVGGASEALEARPGSFTLTIANRRGFSRIALKHGTALVPVFAFGENDLYDQCANPSGSWLRRFQTTMMKWLSFSPPMFHGRGIFNYNFGILPYRRPINVVVGSPLDVPRISEPTDEEINEVHSNYVKHLTDLFETHKGNYGISESQHLHII